MASVAQPFITLKSATFRLGNRLVFENTSWIFCRHEQWAVIGANGSGKSLFADAIRGKLPIVGGELIYHFKGAEGLSPEERIGHVAFEDRRAPLHGTVVQSRWNSSEQDPARSVVDFLSYDRVMSINPFEVRRADDRGRTAFEKRSRWALDLLSLGHFLDRDLLSLSNGETQRVHLARALSLPLRLLILDEPFIGLDAATRHHFRIALERLIRASLPILLLTARPDDLPRGITHCLLLDDCRVIGAGSCTDILKIARRFVGSQTPSTRKRQVPPKPVRKEKASPRQQVILVELQNIAVRYGSATILNGIDWTIQRGESWALLGPNGSGKTTLLSLILGDNPQAYTNEVIVFGKRRGSGESIWELKRQIGWVSPELQLHFDDSITCLDAVLSGFHDTVGLFEPVTRRQKIAARKWLDRFKLNRLANAPLFSLSSGLQRMALLARALVKQPRLLVLDEPCQGLDPQHRDLFINSVDDLISSGTETAIYVTHRQEEIPPAIRRVLRLQNGRVLKWPRDVTESATKGFAAGPRAKQSP